jgi:hypothetical protein
MCYRPTHNTLVLGSTPRRPAKKIKGLRENVIPFLLIVQQWPVASRV